MNIVVTGANGQLGSQLKDSASLDWMKFSFLDRNDLDLCDELDVVKKLEQLKPNIILNCAAYTNVDKAETEIDIAKKVNHEGVINLIKYIKKNNNETILFHVSTDYVFNGKKNNPYSEKDSTSPINAYGFSKLLGEEEIIKSGIMHVILRTSWVFSKYKKNFLTTMLKLADRHSIDVVNDQIGGPTSTSSIVSTIFLFIEKIKFQKFDDWGIYHFCGYPYASWADFANHVFEELNKKTNQKIPIVNNISSKEFMVPAKRPKSSKLSCEKIKSIGIQCCDWKNEVKKIILEL